MIHLNVWLSFKDEATERAQPQRVRAFLTDLQSRGQINAYRLLRNRSASSGEHRTLPRFHALIMFRDADQFRESANDVAAIGIHSGKHGFMIENVTEFMAESLEELTEPDPAENA